MGIPRQTCPGGEELPTPDLEWEEIEILPCLPIMQEEKKKHRQEWMDLGRWWWGAFLPKPA